MTYEQLVLEKLQAVNDEFNANVQRLINNSRFLRESVPVDFGPISDKARETLGGDQIKRGHSDIAGNLLKSLDGAVFASCVRNGNMYMVAVEFLGRAHESNIYNFKVLRFGAELVASALVRDTHVAGKGGPRWEGIAQGVLDQAMDKLEPSNSTVEARAIFKQMGDMVAVEFFDG